MQELQFFALTTMFKKSLKIPKGVIRIRKSKKDRQHNDQKKNDKRKTIYKTWT